MTSTLVQGKLPCPNCPSSDAYHEYTDHGFCFSCKYYKSFRKEAFGNLNEYTYEFIPLRGITKESLSFYDVKTKIDRNGKPVSLGFRYPNGAFKIRVLDHKDFYTEGEINKGGLFGRDRFSAGCNDNVII